MSREKNIPVNLDTQADAVYIQTAIEVPPHVHTFELGSNIRLDVAGDGLVVGVETLNVSTTVGILSRATVAQVSDAIRTAREDNL